MIISQERIDAMTKLARERTSAMENVKARLAKSDDRRSASPAQRQARRAQLLAESADGAGADRQLERIIGGNDLVSINYLAIGAARARSVCRIHLRDQQQRTIGFGTGFLVAPGIVMTNHHVIGNTAAVGTSLAEFDYELDPQSRDKPVARFAILKSPAPIAVEGLDFCLAQLAPTSEDGRSIDSFSFLRLNAMPGKAIVGEYLTIIQHPAGERKQVCVRENKLLKYDDNGSTLWYQTDTLAGSSGSPITNGLWQVVGLHHKGIPKTNANGDWLDVDGNVWDPSTDESRVQWLANEGIRISAILRYLRAERASDPIAAKVLAAVDQPAPDRESVPQPEGQPAPQVSDGTLTLTVPVSIRVSMGAPTTGGAPSWPAPSSQTSGVFGADAPKPPSPASSADSDFEAVHIDQSNYDARPGYDPNFLGTGKLSLPLPKPPAKDLLVVTKGSKKISRLDYWTYSVLMSKSRKLALVAATNVNTRQRDSKSERKGDTWYFDTRIPESAQIGSEFYAEQREFEMDRSQNPFDRGHLCKRMDCQWGPNQPLAKRNGDDSFHFTNCTPQYYLFNQGAKQWLGLEDYVTDKFASATGRCSVFNGPIFDAPRSITTRTGGPRLNIAGPREPDPTFGDVKIPKLFYKIVACLNESGKPAAMAFIMSQEEFLGRIDRLRGWKSGPRTPDEVLTDAEARKYQVKVADIEKLTGLDFGALRTW